jgi:hypothetical protein
LSRASWAHATVAQRRQAEAYAELVARIPDIPGLPRRSRELPTPHLDHLAAAGGSADGHEVAAAVFEVAVVMVGPAHAAAAADDLIRLAPDVQAHRLSPLDVRNIAVARAGREARAEQATDLVGYADAQVFELRRPVVAPTSMLSPELIDAVISYAEAVYGRALTREMRRVIDDGLAVVVELIENDRGDCERPGAALVSMQAHQSGGNRRCLSSVYRERGMGERVSIALAGVLAGRGGDPQTSLLWHTLRGTPPEQLPARLVRWARRDISDLDQGQFADDLDRARVRHRLTAEVTRQWSRRQHHRPDEGQVVGK